MRKRSGGLHCNSEEELIKMANLLQDGVGLFYDERNEILFKKLQELSLQEKVITGSHPLNKQKKESSMFFENFNYDKDQEDQKRYQQQLQEEQKQIQKYLKKVQIVVISLEKKASDLNVENAEEQKFILKGNQGRILNLYLQKRTFGKQTFIFCYWIVNKEHISSPIVKVYLQKAEKILNICEEDLEFEENLMLKLKKCKAMQVKEEVEKLFIF